MYKKFVMGIAAMAALTLVSCSSDDLDSFSDNSSKNEAISFDGYLGRSAVAVNGTRGSVETVTNLQTDGFGVFGNYSKETTTAYGNNLFANQQVTYDKTKSKWTYSPLKYWPTEGHIDFLAYAPYNAGKVQDPYSLEFNVSEKITEQKDLLYTNKTVGQTMTNNSGTKKVTFKFDHALSRLGYSVKLNGTCSSDATITLKKITLAGSAPATTGSTTEPTGAFHKTGTINLSTGNWTPTSDKQAFKWYSAETKGSQSITFTSENSTSTSNKAYTNNGDEYLFVIPQDFSKAGNTLFVIVEYTIQYTGVKGSDGQPATMTNKVYKQLSYNFEQGKAYTINLTIGRPIDFDVDAEITPWDDKTTIPEISLD